ncbi:hypothetical protein GCM10010411_76790 [Actinomadura fulvescens]|uniref:Uncharacterized protein n=1 Tax=Actinomadura fulvescens TaxID=46160 RepID=A0ABN3QJI3_9ACTN
MVSTTHIHALLTAGLTFPGVHLRWTLPGTHPSEVAYLTTDTAGRVGAMLLAENRRLVNHRYDEDDWEAPYLFHRLPGPPARSPS